MNRDGSPDLVVLAGSKFSILTNQGDGTFAPALTVPSGTHSSAFAAADFDADGQPDLAVMVTRGIGVLRRNPAGKLMRKPACRFRYPFRGLAAGDLNGDAYPDLVVGRLRLSGGSYGIDHSAFQVLVLHGRGDGTFADGGQYAVRKYPETVAIGDFNRDAQADVAVSEVPDGGGVRVYDGAAGGSLAGFVRYPCPRPAALLAADLNGDGWLDLAAAAVADGLVGVLPGGPGGFQGPILFPVTELRGSIATGDLDGDGRLELAVCAGVSRGAVVIFALLHGEGLTPVQSVPVDPAPAGVTVADLDHDGLADVAVTSAAASTVTVLINRGASP